MQTLANIMVDHQFLVDCWCSTHAVGWALETLPVRPVYGMCFELPTAPVLLMTTSSANAMLWPQYAMLQLCARHIQTPFLPLYCHPSSRACSTTSSYRHSNAPYRSLISQRARSLIYLVILWLSYPERETVYSSYSFINIIWEERLSLIVPRQCWLFIKLFPVIEYFPE